MPSMPRNHRSNRSIEITTQMIGQAPPQDMHRIRTPAICHQSIHQLVHQSTYKLRHHCYRLCVLRTLRSSCSYIRGTIAICNGGNRCPCACLRLSSFIAVDLNWACTVKRTRVPLSIVSRFVSPHLRPIAPVRCHLVVDQEVLKELCAHAPV